MNKYNCQPNIFSNICEIHNQPLLCFHGCAQATEHICEFTKKPKLGRWANGVKELRTDLQKRANELASNFKNNL